VTLSETHDSSISHEPLVAPHLLAAEEVAARLEMQPDSGLTNEQVIFGTSDITLADWGIATAVAASVLIFEEGRKLGLAVLGGLSQRAAPAEGLQL
jgi:hypothetical protein